MVREIISVSIGQCGIQVSDCVWQQFCLEDDIDPNGNQSPEKCSGNNIPTFFIL